MSYEGIIYLVILPLLSVASVSAVTGQVKTPQQNLIAASIELDSITVVAQQAGFDVEEFIDIVKSDTSFYAAFQNLRFLNYPFEASVKTTYVGRNSIDTFYADASQIFEGKCRRMEMHFQAYTPRFFSKGKKNRYLTGTFYESLFLTPDPICNQSRTGIQSKPKGTKDKYIHYIKQIIFQPGQENNIPIIGKRLAIFNETMRQGYDFKISSKMFDTYDCYVFSADVKPAAGPNWSRKTILKRMTSYFNKSDFQVVFRQYHLQYEGPIASFDVYMKVSIDRNKEVYFPRLINAFGYIDAPFKKREQLKFSLTIPHINL